MKIFDGKIRMTSSSHSFFTFFIKSRLLAISNVNKRTIHFPKLKTSLARNLKTFFYKHLFYYYFPYATLCI